MQGPRDGCANEIYDVAIIGAGIAGMATAARLQRRGLSTIVLESHRQVGGCAGYYCRRGFSFDVGATTLVDFEPGGVGAELLDSIGMALPAGEPLPGYVAWLPDRCVTLHRDPEAWNRERLRALGDSHPHRQFWRLTDRLAQVFWRASRAGVTLPIRNALDVAQALHRIGAAGLSCLRYVGWTMGDALRSHGLQSDRALRGLLAMLIEDTVHSSVEDAPLINAALGITIRGAGLTRALGGMRGFWRQMVAHYRRLGGRLQVNCIVHGVSGHAGDFAIATSCGWVRASQVVSAIPVELTARIAPATIAHALKPYLRNSRNATGGAALVCLGAPEEEVADQAFTHHQLLQDYSAPLGNGNNMFVSVSSPGDRLSAPEGHRAVMISTHCPLDDWREATGAQYTALKQAIGGKLIALARRAYPRLGRDPVVMEVATPRTYERFTRRPDGAVGGFKQTLANANQRAIPHNLGWPGFWLAGDTTWPGLGTVACVLGSRIVADGVAQMSGRLARRMRPPSTHNQERHREPVVA
jgi:C-3',4' desaturase CrtD